MNLTSVVWFYSVPITHNYFQHFRENGKSTKDIKRRTGVASAQFGKLNKIMEGEQASIAAIREMDRNRRILFNFSSRFKEYFDTNGKQSWKYNYCQKT